MNWQNYFEHNREHRLVIPWEEGVHVEFHLCKPLIRSLQKFQIGESGEGRHLRQRAAETGDADYAASIGLFIKEEQEHARLMAHVLKLLGAPLLESHWSDHCFVFLRHIVGLHQQLMVLLMPEMIAKRYFRALHEGTNDPVLRAVTAQIMRDEDGHLAFHIDYLRDAFASLSFSKRILALVLWRILFRLVCGVVIWDHGSVLRAAGVPPKEFWRDCGQIFDEVAAGIFYRPQVFAQQTCLERAGLAAR